MENIYMVIIFTIFSILQFADFPMMFFIYNDETDVFLCLLSVDYAVLLYSIRKHITGIL